MRSSASSLHPTSSQSKQEREWRGKRDRLVPSPSLRLQHTRGVSFTRILRGRGERERATTLKPRAVCVVVGNFHIATLVDAPSIAVLFCQPRYETSGVHSKRRRHVDATSEVARADKHTQPRTRRERRTRALAFWGGRPGQARHCKDREEARQSKNRPPLPDRCAHGAQPPGTCKPPPIPTAAHAHAP